MSLKAYLNGMNFGGLSIGWGYEDAVEHSAHMAGAAIHQQAGTNNTKKGALTGFAIEGIIVCYFFSQIYNTINSILLCLFVGVPVYMALFLYFFSFRLVMLFIWAAIIFHDSFWGSASSETFHGGVLCLAILVLERLCYPTYRGPDRTLLFRATTYAAVVALAAAAGKTPYFSMNSLHGLIGSAGACRPLTNAYEAMGWNPDGYIIDNPERMTKITYRGLYVVTADCGDKVMLQYGQRTLKRNLAEWKQPNPSLGLHSLSEVTAHEQDLANRQRLATACPTVPLPRVLPSCDAAYVKADLCRIIANRFGATPEFGAARRNGNFAQRTYSRDDCVMAISLSSNPAMHAAHYSVANNRGVLEIGLSYLSAD